MSKDINAKKKEDLPVELENQFVLRMPEPACHELRKLIRSGSNSVKERLKIAVENDMRHGTVRFDNWIWPAKLMDLPCILETYKTIDRKTFYKTADICQMLMCKEDDDSQTEEEEPINKKDKKEVLKAEKKYHYPYGITPPLKNVRKRRFRKTLKKKYVDAPEIEKEVKRLFRVDNEAVNVRWEVITDEDDGSKSKQILGESNNGGASSPGASGGIFSNSQSLDIAEHDIFGEVVSSSDEEGGEVNIVDSGEDEASRLSNSILDDTVNTSTELVTQFSKKMLRSNSPSSTETTPRKQEISNSIQTALEDAGIMNNESRMDTGEDLTDKLEELVQQLRDIRARRQAREQEIASIENQALKQRFQSLLDEIIAEEKAKQHEYDVIYACYSQQS
ncbi:transcription initiation factor TFIID subunit 7 [Chamberlinius hualienensis]